MKPFFFLLLAFNSNYYFSQNFSISSSIADSIGLNQYNYVLEGSTILTNETVFHAVMLDSTNTNILVSGDYYMDESVPSTLSNFSFDSETKIYHFEMGVFNTDKNVVHLWLTENNIITQEMFYQE